MQIYAFSFKSSNFAHKLSITMSNDKKVCIHTLGCKLNFAESSTLARQFENGGWERTDDPRQAEINIINSCSVTEHSDKKCRNLIGHIHRLNPQSIIAVTGCYAQLCPDRIAAIEGVDIVLSNNDKGNLYDRVKALSGKGKAEVYGCSTDQLTSFFSAFSSGDRTRAYLKVQDGCDYCCTYCTIHNARGSSRNTPIDRLVEQANEIAAAGQREIVITGVNTGDFGRTTGESFIDLLRALNAVEGIDRYRISSIEPNLLTDEIVDFCADSPKFQPHFHIPIQSGSDNVLRRMGRRYNTARFAERIAKVKAAMPDAFVGIDVIVGFPGETDDDFRTTYSLLESLQPAYLHIFPFSERAGTPATTMPDKVRDSIKTERAEQLGRLCNKQHADFYSRYVGSVRSVLFEGSRKGGMMYGFTDNYIKVSVPFDQALINQIRPVKLVSVDENCLMSGIIDE